MPRTAELRVNVFKKVRIRNQWVLCPAVPERNGRFLDRVRIAGEIEIHHEGTYYLEWREGGLRRRQAVPQDGEPHYHAQIKEVELRTSSLGLSTAPQSVASPAEPPQVPSEDPPHGFPDPTSAAQQFMQSMALFMQQMAGTTPSAAPAPRKSLSFTAASVTSQVTPAPTTPLTQPTFTTHPSATVVGTINGFLKDVEPPQREWKTYEEYRNVLYYFRDQTTKVYVKDIGRDDCLEFMRYLYSIGNEARTVFNRIGIVLHWLRLNGVTRVLEKGDKPNYVENRREMYQQEDLEALFRACNPDEKIRYLFFLLTGERDKEVRYTAWTDIDFKRRCVWVTAKKQLRFKPKDKEERRIPVPSSLLAALLEYKSRQKGPNPHNLVFPTSEGKPDKKFENKLKRIARRAGLNCGHCLSKYGNACSKGPHCSKWFLHKFRHTFATNQLEEGVSIRTLQEWLGHSDLESTMVYLKYVDSKEIHTIVDNTAIARLAASSTGRVVAFNGTEEKEVPVLARHGGQ